MIEKDTVRLLRECDAGVKMGMDAIDEVLHRVKSRELRQRLLDCKSEHHSIDRELNAELRRFSDRGKEPNPVAQKLSWLKTEAILSVNATDSSIADIMTDGCNMGVKSLGRYLNQYVAAEEKAKDLTKRLIDSEERLSHDIRAFL